MKQPSFASIVFKTAAVHTVTYFIIGVLSYLVLDYTAKYADPAVASFVRQTGDPLVAAGPFFQILRGILFGIAFYILRESIFPQKRGWLTLWLAPARLFHAGDSRRRRFCLVPTLLELAGLAVLVRKCFNSGGMHIIPTAR